MNNEKLNILWTTGDEITSEKMVLMYSTNGKLHNWWSEITIIIWGGSSKLIGDSNFIREKVKDAMDAGVKFSACKACSDQLGTTDILLEVGIEVKYWGEDLTKILKEDGKLLTV